MEFVNGIVLVLIGAVLSGFFTFTFTFSNSKEEAISSIKKVILIVYDIMLMGIVVFFIYDAAIADEPLTRMGVVSICFHFFILLLLVMLAGFKVILSLLKDHVGMHLGLVKIVSNISNVYKEDLERRNLPK